MQVRFKFECLVSKRILTKWDIPEQLCKLLATLKDSIATIALQSLEAAGNRVFDVEERLAKDFIRLSKNAPSSQVLDNDDFVMVPRVIVTPLRVYCEGPVAEISNVRRSFLIP